MQGEILVDMLDKSYVIDPYPMLIVRADDEGRCRKLLLPSKAKLSFFN